LLGLQGVPVVQRPIVGEGIILVRRMGKGRERLDSPTKPCLAVSTLSVWLALNDEREEPPISLAHDVAADNLARCSTFLTRRKKAANARSSRFEGSPAQIGHDAPGTRDGRPGSRSGSIRLLPCAAKPMVLPASRKASIRSCRHYTGRSAAYGLASLLQLKGDADHVHLLISLPPNPDLSNFVNNLKTSSRLLRKEFAAKLSRVYRKPVFWSRSY
jgi:hypothetical protein